MRELTEEDLDAARRIATRIYHAYPGVIFDISDAISDGNFGLVNAQRTFNPALGLWESWRSKKVRTAIFNGIRYEMVRRKFIQASGWKARSEEGEEYGQLASAMEVYAQDYEEIIEDRRRLSLILKCLQFEAAQTQDAVLRVKSDTELAKLWECSPSNMIVRRNSFLRRFVEYEKWTDQDPDWRCKRCFAFQTKDTNCACGARRPLVKKFKL